MAITKRKPEFPPKKSSLVHIFPTTIRNINIEMRMRSQTIRRVSQRLG
jgi:hypothetical protein